MHYFSGKGCSEFLESMHYCIGILRINELCKEHNLNYYALAYKAAIPKSTLLNIIHGTNPTIETIQKICGGFDISLGTFFNTDYFYEIYDDE